jgi:hypothetical protein
MSERGTFQYLQGPNFLLYEADDGWRYKQLHGYTDVDETKGAGPFETAMEAVMEAAATMDLRHINWRDWPTWLGPMVR